jgi:3-oxoacyl-[acyl-carrier protein] reductase
VGLWSCLCRSTGKLRGNAYLAGYAVTKGAVISLTKSRSPELAPKEVGVNCVAPGWVAIGVAIDMSASTFADLKLDAKIREGIPVGRVASPPEIAGTILFLSTPLPGFVIGEILKRERRRGAGGIKQRTEIREKGTSRMSASRATLISYL